MLARQQDTQRFFGVAKLSLFEQSLTGAIKREDYKAEDQRTLNIQ